MVKEAEVYDKMGDFYDLVYSEAFDSDLYLKEAKKCRGTVLELGCGTGRITVRLLKAGIDITGLDISETMLRLLRQNAEKEGVKAKTHLGDMRNFKSGGKFRLAIYPYRSFMHLLAESDRRQALRNIYAHLENGGKIVLHIYRPSKDELGCTGRLHPVDCSIAMSNGKKYVLKWFMQYHPKSRTADYVIKVKDSEGKDVNRFDMTVSFIDQGELRELLEECGFRSIKTYCGFDYAAFDDSCSEIVVMAEK